MLGKKMTDIFLRNIFLPNSGAIRVLRMGTE